LYHSSNNIQSVASVDVPGFGEPRKSACFVLSLCLLSVQYAQHYGHTSECLCNDMVQSSLHLNWSCAGFSCIREKTLHALQNYIYQKHICILRVFERLEIFLLFVGFSCKITKLMLRNKRDKIMITIILTIIIYYIILISLQFDEGTSQEGEFWRDTFWVYLSI
jgi:hypothetical protein